MLQISQIQLPPEHTPADVIRKTAKILGVLPEKLGQFQILKRSVDARKKPDVKISYTVCFTIDKEKQFLLNARKKKAPWVKRAELYEEVKYRFPEPGQKPLTESPIIVGMGPAGLFCAYYLAMHGYRPVLLERGRDVEKRTQDVEKFWKTGILDLDSNVQFGEGGAGTFSDGKLNTLLKDKDGRNREVLKTFVDCGADPSILYEGKPHIGTDVLGRVVKTMRERILQWGGRVYFEHKLVDIETEKDGLTRLVIDAPKGRTELATRAVVLAIGHSARDTFQMLYDRKLSMEQKAFAVGFRVQHPQRLINLDQYGSEEAKGLSAASYKVTAHTGTGRSVYSFCMCPGGYVVNASSEENRLAINGMSYSGRDGENANSAIIISVTPKDFPTEHPLAGVAFQRSLEERAFQAGGGKIPSQRYGEFCAGVQRSGQTGSGRNGSGQMCMQQEANVYKSQSQLQPQMRGDTFFTDLTGILPEELNRAFVEGMEQFGRVLPGFDRADTILSAVESRTSSPVRILRDASCQALHMPGIYPCGEGAGYAGGITSAAMDGMRVAEQIASVYQPFPAGV